MFGVEKPLPRPSEDSAPFWEAAAEGGLHMQRCGDAGRVRFAPAWLCARGLSEHSEWVVLSGRGSVYSWIVVHQSQHPAFNADVPYNVAIIELEEGPRLHTNIVGCSNERIHIGMPVEVVFDKVSDDTALVKFRPRNSSGGAQ